MSVGYRAIGWNRQKKIYDRVLVGGVALYLLLFIGIGAALHPEATAETLLLRSFGSAAFLLLQLVLSIGPLCRLDPAFLPLLYNRRHLGVTLCLVAGVHAAIALVQFHFGGNVNALVSALSSNTRYDSIEQFPIEPLGIAALFILFLMAATSHDFWLAQLTPPVWKRLHMGVYVAYGLVVMHVVLGTLMAERHPVLGWLVGSGLVWVIGLHLAAAWRERRRDDPSALVVDWVDAGPWATIPEGRARIVCAGGERVAIFRHDEKLSAVSNVCRHQNGPLGEGRVIDGCITCPWHGYQYRPEDGASPPPFTEKVPTFALRVEGERVWVDPRPKAPGTRIEPIAIGSAAPSPPGEEFYVGYLPEPPPRLALRTARTVGGVLGLALVVSATLAAVQSRYGSGTFEFGTLRTFQGVIREQPHPTLAVPRPAAGIFGAQATASRYLLVAPWKSGAAPLVRGLDGQAVTLRGTLVHREGQTMIELKSGSVLPTNDEPRAPTPVVQLGTMTLSGEIVDSKCYLGVMKPGHFKPHRACATRCIAGGIPPLLVVRETDERIQTFLLVGPDGRPLGPEILDHIAEPVTVRGEVERHDDLLVLKLETLTASSATR